MRVRQPARKIDRGRDREIQFQEYTFLVDRTLLDIIHVQSMEEYVNLKKVTDVVLLELLSDLFLEVQRGIYGILFTYTYLHIRIHTRAHMHTQIYIKKTDIY